MTTENLKEIKQQILAVAITIAAALLIGVAANAQTSDGWKMMKGDVTMLMANDLGRNGYYEQKPVAELMGGVAAVTGPECVAAAGDIHHFNGVRSVDDPLWMTNYELVYAHPELMLDWFPVLGNHEYRGNTQAVLDYSAVSRRWMMPARYYSRVLTDNGVSLRVVFIDTTPLIDRYRKNTDTYPDVAAQDMEAQLSWLDTTLRDAREDWIVVIGHHPIYSQTSKDESERSDMQRRVMPLLHKYGNVDIYACGHIHNFQHIRRTDDPIDYVVNSSASLARKVSATEGTVFCSPEEGFSVITATADNLRLFMVGKSGKVLHTVTRNK